MQKSLTPNTRSRTFLVLLAATISIIALTNAFLVSPTSYLFSRPLSSQSQNATADFLCQGVPCASQIMTTDFDVPIILHSSSLVSTLPQTEAAPVWLLVFDHPDACQGTCGEDDLLIPETKASLIYAQATIQDFSQITSLKLSTDASETDLTTLVRDMQSQSKPEIHMFIPDLALSDTTFHLSSMAIAPLGCGSNEIAQTNSTFQTCLELNFSSL